MEFFLYSAPVVILIYLMIKPNPMKASKAFFVALMAILTITAFLFTPSLILATSIKGALTALTPITIIFGAIFLFEVLKATGGMKVIEFHLNNVAKTNIAKLMIIGWAFSFLIEGASGFGTPAALTAPILIGLGFNPLKTLIFTLILNSIPVTFGAVGTPIWFGLSPLDMAQSQLLEISFYSALINSIVGLFLPFIALCFILPIKEIKKNWLYVLLVSIFTIIPYFLCSLFSYEFPSLIGGASAILSSIILSKFNIGLVKTKDSKKKFIPDITNLIKKSFPLWGTIVLLLITRIELFGIKSLLQIKEPFFVFESFLGELILTPSLSIGLENILGFEISWLHHTLYIPSILPFILIGTTTIFINKKTLFSTIFNKSLKRVKTVSITLIFALIFVALMMLGDENSAISHIGKGISQVLGDYWIFFAAFLGSLGSFFSGSATISNLTFSPIQFFLAEQNMLNPSLVLALQSVGAAMGNMICVNNIIAASAIVGLNNVEGKILTKTIKPMLFYGFLSGLIAFIITLI